MKIGILGSGPVGLTLGKGLIQTGHHVTIGTRNPSRESLQQWIKKQGKQAVAGTFRQAAEFGELLLICTSWIGTKKAIEAVAKENSYKYVLDTSTGNVLYSEPADDILPLVKKKLDSMPAAVIPGSTGGAQGGMKPAPAGGGTKPAGGAKPAGGH